MVLIRAVQLIEFAYHAHLVSKAGFMISSKSASPSSDESPSIMNAILFSLSVNYGSV